MSGLVALAFAYVFSQFYRSFLAVLTPILSVDLGMSKADLSYASGLWFIAFGLMQFVVGICLDRYGPRRTASVLFGLFGVAGASIFATATSPIGIILGMGFFGIGCSPVLMAAMYLFARQFTPARFAMLSSWMVAIGNLGNVVSTSPMASAVELFGWREVMLALGLGNAIVAIAVLSCVKDPAPELGHNDGVRGYLRLLKIPALWTLLPVALITYASVAGIRGLWVGPYLNDLFAADSLLIGKISLWMAIAMVTGSVLYGPLDQLFNTRKWIVFTGGLINLIAISILAWQPQQSLMIATLLLVMMGLAGTSYAVIMAHGRSFIPAELIGRGVTLLNFFSIFGVGLFQLITGSIVTRQADPAAASTYQLLFGTYAISLALALMVYLNSTDSKPRLATGRPAMAKTVD